MFKKSILKNKLLSIVIPVHNEEKVIEKFLCELENFLKDITENYELILIDDGSHDNTRNIILKNFPQTKLICLSRNFGKEAALTAGIESCSGDVAILMDADFQHPFETIKTFLEYWDKGYNMVYGIRENRKDERFFKKLYANIFYKVINKMSDTTIPKNAGDFRLIDKKVISSINECKESDRFMKGLYMWVGFKSIGVKFKVQERLLGSTSWSFKNLTELALTGITSFSAVPLRMWSFVGFFISSLSFLIALYIIGKTIIFGKDAPGYASIIVAIMFLGGVQLTSIGILGEYIGKIFQEVKKRPKYIISEKHGF